MKFQPQSCEKKHTFATTKKLKNIKRNEEPQFCFFGTTEQEIKEGDTVYMIVGEPNQEFEKALIRKIFTVDDLNDDGDIMVKLATSDTEDVVPGCYYLEMRIKLANGNIGVIVPARKFFIFA